MARRTSRRGQKTATRDNLWIPHVTQDNSLVNGTQEESPIVIGNDWGIGTGLASEKATLMTIRGEIAVTMDWVASTTSTVFIAFIVGDEDSTSPSLDTTAPYLDDCIWTACAMGSNSGTELTNDNMWRWPVNVKSRRVLSTRDEVKLVIKMTGTAGAYSCVLRTLIRRA